MGKESGGSIGVAVRGGGISAAPRTSIGAPLGGERAAFSIGRVGGTTAFSRFESSHMTPLGRSARGTESPSGPRLTLSHRPRLTVSPNVREGGVDQKFTLRTISGRTLDTDSSPQFRKTGNVSGYRPHTPRSLGAYAEFAPLNSRATRENAVTRRTSARTSSEQAHADASRFGQAEAPLGISEATRARIRTYRRQTSQRNAAPLRESSRRLERAIDKKSASVRQGVLYDANVRPLVLQRARQRGIERRLLASQIDRNRLYTPEPVNPTRRAPEYTRSAPANPEFTVQQTTAEKRAATVRNELEKIATEQATVHPAAVDNPSEKALQALVLPDAKPQTTTQKLQRIQLRKERIRAGLEQRTEKTSIINTLRTQLRQSADKVAARVKKATATKTDPLAIEEDDVAAIVMAAENDEKRKRKRLLHFFQRQATAQPAEDMVASTDAVAAILPAADVQMMQSAQPSQEPAAKRSSAASPSGKEQAAVRPAEALPTQPITTGENRSSRLKRVINTFPSRLRRKNNGSEKETRFKFFKPAQDKRKEQWKNAVSAAYPSADPDQAIPLSVAAQRLAAPTTDTASPIANALGIPDGGDAQWRNKLLGNNESATRYQALQEGDAQIDGIRPVYQNDSGPDVSDADVRLVFSGEKKKEESPVGI